MQELSSSSGEEQQGDFSRKENGKLMCNHCEREFDSKQSKFKRARHLKSVFCLAARATKEYPSKSDTDTIESQESSSSDSERESMAAIDEEPYQDQLDAAQRVEDGSTSSECSSVRSVSDSRGSDSNEDENQFSSDDSGVSFWPFKNETEWKIMECLYSSDAPIGDHVRSSVLRLLSDLRVKGALSLSTFKRMSFYFG
jgi:hypothetical protein